MSSAVVAYKTVEEIAAIRTSSLLVGKTLAEVARHIRPGVSTAELDRIAEEYIRDHKGEPSFKAVPGYSHTLCVSVNEEIVHGIPGKREVREGDILSVDCGVYLNGFHGDSAYTFPVGEVGEEKLDLLRATKTSLYKGIAKAVAGNRIGDISAAIQEYAESKGYGVVRELVGHGIGRKLHEKPEVPNYGRKGSGMQLKSGMTIAIEPMINMGTRYVRQLPDGWTVITNDRKPSAHFEHTVAIGEQAAEILSSFTDIEEAISKNENITEIIATLI
jgi:methionyl aminopeptidase